MSFRILKKFPRLWHFVFILTCVWGDFYSASLVGKFNEYEILFYRNFFAAVFTLPFCKKQIKGLKFDILRGVLTFFGFYIFLVSVQYIGFTNSNVIQYLTPGISIILATIFFKEKFNRYNFLFCLIILIWVGQLIFYWKFVLGAIAFSLCDILIKFSKSEALEGVFVVSLVMCVMCVPKLATLPTMQLLFLGILNLVSQILLIESTNNVEMSKLVPIKFLNIPISQYLEGRSFIFTGSNFYILSLSLVSQFF